MQIRLAAQELLVAELKNMGPQGRRHLVEKWRGFLPKYGDPPFQANGPSGGDLTSGHTNGGNSDAQCVTFEFGGLFLTTWSLGNALLMTTRRPFSKKCPSRHLKKGS